MCNGRAWHHFTWQLELQQAAFDEKSRPLWLYIRLHVLFRYTQHEDVMAECCSALR